MRLTATRAVTLTAVTAQAPFHTPALAGPRTLAKGETTEVPVSFTPGDAGQSSGALELTVRSAAGAATTSLDLRGYGTRPGLLASPEALDFGTVVTGTPRQLSVQVTNVGRSAATVTGVTRPGGAFTVTGLPEVGTRIAPQASVAVTVLAAPAAAGPLSGALRLTTGTGPPLTVALTGTAVSGAPEMQLPAVVDVGDVPVGLSADVDFAVTNVGNVPMRITKAKPPAGRFRAAQPLAEGLTVPPGDTVHQVVTFTPTATGPVQEAYLITADDGSGMHTVALRGRGVFDPIAVKYAQTGGATVFPPSLLGNPLGPEKAVAGGQMQSFTRGDIYWSRATGAHVVMGDILGEYRTTAPALAPARRCPRMSGSRIWGGGSRPPGTGPARCRGVR